SLPAVSMTQAGGYSLRAVNFIGAMTSPAATLTVVQPPSITSQPASQTVLAGTDLSLSVAVTGTAPFDYQWQLDGLDLSGPNLPILNLTSIQSGQSGDYRVRVSNLGGTVFSSVAWMNVNVPPAITLQPQGQTVVQGDTATFSVAATGTGPLSYQWRFNDADIGGATGATLPLANV